MRVTAELNDERQKNREREKECQALKEKIKVSVFNYVKCLPNTNPFNFC